MSTPAAPAPGDDCLPITDVERLTGIRQATLRMWERRYGFPQPLRDRHGDRIYPPDQVERLLAARRLMQQGLRPGRIFAGGAGPSPGAAPTAALPSAQHQFLIGLLRGYRLAELHAQFQFRLMDLGLRRFVIGCLAPLSASVDAAWSRGELPVRCIHLYVQLVAAFLQGRLATVRSAGDGRPRAILATLPGEVHALGIMMTEAVLTALEVDCLPLGAGVPPDEVAAAARESGAGIVALSFSSAYPRKGLLRVLAPLRASLPASTALWIGGAGARHAIPAPAGIDVFSSLDAIEPALAHWRARS